MITINYITYDSWWDTDTTVIPKLSEVFNVQVYCLNQRKNQKYPIKTVPDNVCLESFYQNYRDRAPRSSGVALRLFYRSIVKGHHKGEIYFFIPGKNLCLLLLMLLFAPRLYTIISSHNYVEHGDERDIGSKMMNSLRTMFYRRFKYFHFFSKNQLDLFKKDYPGKKAFSTEMPLKDFGVAISHERHNSKVNLLFFGLIRAYKRLDLFIEAVKSIDNSNLRVVIAGNASEKDIKKYSDMIDGCPAFETHFGFVRNEDIAQLFVDTDFLVLPYESSTQSGPSLIAINYGIPIIASDIPVFKRLVTDGENGFLFEMASMDKFKDVLTRVSQMSCKEINVMKSNQRLFKDEYNKKNDIASSFYRFINSF